MSQPSQSSFPTISFTALITLFLILPNLPPTHSLSHQKTISKHNFLIIRMKGNTNNNSYLIQTTCKNTPNYDLCLSTLQSDPRTADITDVSGLALVFVDVIKVKATLTVDRIKKLQNSNPEYNFPLFECGVLYNAILKADVPEAIEGLRKGVPKFAEAAMDDAALEVRVCEQSFEEDKTPLSDVNKAVYDLSVVAKSIIRLLL